MAFASGYFKTSYAAELVLVETRTQRLSLALFLVIAAALPFVATPLVLDLANQVLLASLG